MGRCSANHSQAGNTAARNAAAGGLGAGIPHAAPPPVVLSPHPGAAQGLTQALTTPNAIQPHGALLVLEPQGLRILQASANLGRVLGVPAASMLGLPGRALFRQLGWDITERSLRQQMTGGFQPITLIAAEQDRPGLALRPGRSPDGRLYLEIEPAEPAEAGQASPARAARAVAERLGSLPAIPALCAAAAQEIRALTRFDRTLVYRFEANGDGVVIAEDHAPGVGSLLGLRYPAQEIPPEARSLYLRQHLRLIPDMQYAPVAMCCAPGAHTPLDMTYCLLRSPPEVHRSAMQRMGVRSTLVVSLARADGRLWGLLMCHAMEPRAVPPELRLSLETIVQQLCAQLEILQCMRPRTTRKQPAWSRHHATALCRPSGCAQHPWAGQA